VLENWTSLDGAASVIAEITGPRSLPAKVRAVLPAKKKDALRADARHVVCACRARSSTRYEAT